VLAGGDRIAVSTDTLVEGVDFLRTWSAPAEVGAKLVAQNLADIAAMGALPLALVVSLVAPADLPLEWAVDVAGGIDEECRRAGAAMAGGDVSVGPVVVLTGTALGLLQGPPLLRSGASPGDVVALAGRTGPSAAGLALLTAAGSRDAAEATGPASLVRAHVAPRPGYTAGPEAARAGATALIDTSDGLLRDAGRLAGASGVRIDLDLAALQPEEDLALAAAALSDPDAARRWVLTGGEDHALLGCFPPGVALPASFRPVGRVLPAEQGARVLVDGAAWDGADGWHHFSRAEPRA
jgi:thiamine-monophosphate kinase